MTPGAPAGTEPPWEKVGPQGRYRSWIRHGDLIFVSGITPRAGATMLFPGKVGREVTAAQAQEAAAVVANRILSCLFEAAGNRDSLLSILELQVFVAATPDFTDHGMVADALSTVLIETLGDRAIGARAAIGVGSLPGNAPIEAKVVAAVKAKSHGAG